MDARVPQLDVATSSDQATKRWAALGPYYAMFPIDFAREIIATYSEPGDFVLDPFCGRGTTVFCAAEAGRDGLGIEVNPVGWLYAKVKINPASQNAVESRLGEIARLAKSNAYLRSLPEFFFRCYCPDVLAFLVAARRHLNWRERSIDATLMAFILVNLHGRIDENGRPQSLSNQMRQTKAMSQEYSIKWWKENGFRKPPVVDPVKFITERMKWRYAKGRPHFPESVVKLGDCRPLLSRIPSDADGAFSLLLTSPPYSAVTSYYFDQWLRLWMLGDSEIPSRAGFSWKGRFENQEEYKKLIETTFARSARLMAKEATIYVRTDAREFTRDVTMEALKKAFPRKTLTVRKRPFIRKTQTALFGDSTSKPGEIDLILR